MSTVATSSLTPSLPVARIPGLPLLALLVLSGMLFFVGLGDRDLVSSHEARAAQNAQMILDEGHWLVPRLFDQHLELQKPPLYYWLVAALAWLRGGTVDVWAVRLPAALAGLATVLFLSFLGSQRGRPLAGLLAALILATCLHFTWLARVGRIDMPLTMAITFALGGFHLGCRGDVSRLQRLGWHFGSYTWLAVGLLLKGPIAVVLPAVVVLFVWLRHARFDRAAHGLHLLATSLGWGVPWMLAIAGPWFIWANVQTNNQLFEVFFWYHNIERGLGGTETLAAHPWWFYGPRIVVDLFPWSFALPLAVVLCWRHRQASSDDDAWDGWLWFAAIGLFLSCMSFKRADYLLPAYPGMAIFLGACAERWWLQMRGLPQTERMRRLARRAAASVLLIYAIAWLSFHVWFVPAQEKDWPYRRMAREIRRQTDGPIVFFRAESHLLAYHVRPVGTILEWENLRKWADRSIPVYFVMPEKAAREWEQHLPPNSLIEVLRTTDYVNGKRDRPLVVLRNRSQPTTRP